MEEILPELQACTNILYFMVEYYISSYHPWLSRYNRRVSAKNRYLEEEKIKKVALEKELSLARGRGEMPVETIMKIQHLEKVISCSKEVPLITEQEKRTQNFLQKRAGVPISVYAFTPYSAVTIPSAICVQWILLNCPGLTEKTRHVLSDKVSMMPHCDLEFMRKNDPVRVLNAQIREIATDIIAAYNTFWMSMNYTIGPALRAEGSISPGRIPSYILAKYSLNMYKHCKELDELYPGWYTDIIEIMSPFVRCVHQIEEIENNDFTWYHPELKKQGFTHRTESAIKDYLEVFSQEVTICEFFGPVDQNSVTIYDMWSDSYKKIANTKEGNVYFIRERTVKMNATTTIIDEIVRTKYYTTEHMEPEEIITLPQLSRKRNTVFSEPGTAIRTEKTNWKKISREDFFFVSPVAIATPK